MHGRLQVLVPSVHRVGQFVLLQVLEVSGVGLPEALFNGAVAHQHADGRFEAFC
jgi:hypothetical protein